MPSSVLDRAHDVYIAGLRNQHAVENQAIELLERQVSRLENYTEKMGQHYTSHSAFKDTVMSIIGNLAALGHSTASDEVVKNSLANFAFEHYEIASYSSLLTLAEIAGDTQAHTALNTSLREEKAMAQWLADHLDSTVRRFVERSAAGMTAGV